jgi:hypothetical protein
VYGNGVGVVDTENVPLKDCSPPPIKPRSHARRKDNENGMLTSHREDELNDAINESDALDNLGETAPEKAGY